MAGEPRWTRPHRVPGVASRAMPGFQVMSDLLTIREKNIIYSLIQTPCTLIKCTVAQVLQSSEETEGTLFWRSTACGVLCVVRDHSIHAYFLRLFSVQNAELLWEQEVYVPFKYTTLRTYFHTFPADGHHIGFNFTDEAEAEEFRFAVEAIKEDLGTLSFENTSERNDSSSEDSDTRERPSAHAERRTSCPTLSPTATAAFHFDLDYDAFLRRLLSEGRLTEDDLRSRSVSDIVDHIIAQFGGAQGVQTELHRGNIYESGSMTLPRSSGSSLSQPRTPSFPGRPTEQGPPQFSNAVRIKQSASFKGPVDGGKAALLSALTEVLRKRQPLENKRNEMHYENTM